MKLKRAFILSLFLTLGIIYSCNESVPEPLLLSKNLVKREFHLNMGNGNFEITPDSMTYTYSKNRLKSFSRFSSHYDSILINTFHFIYDQNRVFQVHDTTNTSIGYKMTLNEKDLPLSSENTFNDKRVEIKYVNNLIIVNQFKKEILFTDTLEMLNENVVTRRGSSTGSALGSASWHYEYKYSDKPNPYYKLNISPISLLYNFSKNVYIQETVFEEDEVISDHFPIYEFDEDGYMTHIWDNGNVNVYYYE